MQYYIFLLYIYRISQFLTAFDRRMEEVEFTIQPVLLDPLLIDCTKRAKSSGSYGRDCRQMLSGPGAKPGPWTNSAQRSGPRSKRDGVKNINKDDDKRQTRQTGSIQYGPPFTPESRQDQALRSIVAWVAISFTRKRKRTFRLARWCKGNSCHP